MKRNFALLTAGLLTALILTVVLAIGARAGLFVGASKDTRAAEPPAQAVQEIQSQPEIVVTVEAPAVAVPTQNMAASAQEIAALREQLKQVYAEMQRRDAAYRAQLEKAYNQLQQAYTQLEKQGDPPALSGGNPGNGSPKYEKHSDEHEHKEGRNGDERREEHDDDD